jgi:hypothetical protein
MQPAPPIERPKALARPPKAIERVVEFFVPPACREHVVSDLHERYCSPGAYLLEALWTVPVVILSRIRRTTDAGVLLLEALLLYVALFAAAWEFDRSFLYGERGLFALALPAGVTLVVLILEDAYARPGSRSGLKPILQSALAVAFAFLFELFLSSSIGALAAPRPVIAGGLGVGMVLVATVRLLFPPWIEPPKAG